MRWNLLGFLSLRPSTVLIRCQEIVNADGRMEGDILIEDGVIKEISRGIRRKVDVVIGSSSFIALPGAVDIHFHIREPGPEYAESIASGTRAAAHGGITSLFMMPNTEPPVDSPEMVSFVRERALRDALVRVFPVGSATQRREGKKISEYGLMVREGVVAVSDDGRSVSSSFVMRKALEYARTFGIAVIEHAEDPELSGDANEGFLTEKYGLTPYPNAAEDVIVARDIILAELTGGHLHITHVSSARSLEMIKDAKGRNTAGRVTCDVTPHHLIFCDRDVNLYDTNYKVNPPLRSEGDRRKLLEGVVEGVVDAIASDHAPHPEFMKENDFASAPAGISSADFFLPILYHHLVRGDLISLERLVKLISFNPARLFGIPAGEIKEGRLGDVVLFDPTPEYTISQDMIFSKGKNSPYIGMKVTGRVMYTIVGGNICYSPEIT